MTHRIIRLAALTLTIATPLAAQHAPARGEFVIRKGKDTLAVERFTRDGATLSGEIAQSNGMRTEYVLNLRRDDRVDHVEMSRTARQGSSTLSVDLGDTLVRATVSDGKQSQTMSVATTRTPAPYLIWSFALQEQLVRASRLAPGQSAKWLAVRLGAGDTATITATRFHADSVALSMPDVDDVRLAVSRAGDVTGAFRPAQQWLVERRIVRP